VFGPLPVTVICAYDERSLRPEIVREARATHPATVRQGELADSPDYVDPSAFVLD